MPITQPMRVGGRRAGSSSQPACSSASSAAATRELGEAVGAPRLLRREGVGRARTPRSGPRRRAMPDSPAAQRSISAARADAERGDGADARDDDARGSRRARGAPRSIASPTVASSCDVLALDLDAELVLDDLRQLDEVERVDVELLERRVAPDPRRSAPNSSSASTIIRSTALAVVAVAAIVRSSFSVAACSGGQAAVDGQRRAGHVGRPPRRRGSARTRPRPRACPARRAGIGFEQLVAESPRSCSVSMRPGATAFTVTPRRATSAATVLRHPDQAGLRGGVVGLAGVGAQADDRGDVHDPAEAGADHRPQRAAGEAEGGRRGSSSTTRVPVLVARSGARGRRRGCRRC